MFYRIFLLLFLFSGLLSSHAKEAVIKVTVSHVHPYGYLEGKDLKGLNVDYLKKLEKETGLKFEYNLVPHARAQLQMKFGQDDLMIMFARTCNTHSALYMSFGHIYDLYPTFFLKESFVKKSHVRVGRIIGTCSQLLKETGYNITVTELPMMDNVIEMLTKNRLDGICGLPPVINYSLKKTSALSEKLIQIKQAKASDQTRIVLCGKKDLPPESKQKLIKAMKKIPSPVL